MARTNGALDKNVFKKIEYWKRVLSWPLSAMVGEEYKSVSKLSKKQREKKIKF